MDIDDVLTSIGMGRYQIFGLFLIGLVSMYTGLSIMYVFTAGDLKYRCEIRGCDDLDPRNRTYEPEWLRFTTPYREETGQPVKCERYARTTNAIEETQCSPVAFNAAVERCNDGWVFEDYENTVGTEFGLMCEENKWKLSLVGTVNNVGQFVGSLVSGIIADKFGRKFAMIFGSVMSAALCIVQSFSINFPMFLAFEFLSSVISCGVYTVSFVLAMELVVPKHRVLCFSLLECLFPIGAISMAFIASFLKDWRLLLRISYTPALLFLSYIWLTNESMRWLEMQGQRDKVIVMLKKIAKTNNKTLPDLYLSTQTKDAKDLEENNEEKLKVSTLNIVLQSTTIIWRTVKCSFVWIGATLVYYGLWINATDIAGNKYLNFILVSAVEIPAGLLNILVMEKLSRRMALSSMFISISVTCALYNMIPDDYVWTKLSLFMFSKLAMTTAFSIIYILTAEIFPTTIRVTMVSVCSMLGRIGSMLAPHTTLLTVYFGIYVTMLVFGVTALLAAAITMTLPESKDIKLPSTIDQAEKIGCNGNDGNDGNVLLLKTIENSSFKS